MDSGTTIMLGLLGIFLIIAPFYLLKRLKRIYFYPSYLIWYILILLGIFQVGPYEGYGVITFAFFVFIPTSICFLLTTLFYEKSRPIKLETKETKLSLKSLLVITGLVFLYTLFKMVYPLFAFRGLASKVPGHYLKEIIINIFSYEYVFWSYPIVIVCLVIFLICFKKKHLIRYFFIPMLFYFIILNILYFNDHIIFKGYLKEDIKKYSIQVLTSDEEYLKCKNQDNNNDCIMQLAAKNNDINLCTREYPNLIYRNDCFTQIAVLNNDVTYCDNIYDIASSGLEITSGKMVCIAEVAVQSGDESICDKYKSTFKDREFISYIIGKCKLSVIEKEIKYREFFYYLNDN